VLPGGVFRRAFVKQYAKHLGLDADRLVAEFVYAHGEQGQETPAAGRPRERSNPGTLFLIAAVGSAAVLSLWKAAPQREVASEAVSTSVPRVERARAALTPQEAKAATPSEGLVITLQARQTCWIEVRIDGQLALNRVLEQGQGETLLAHAEIVLSVGNAGGLSFTVNDLRGLPLGKSGEVRRNIVITKQSLPSLVEEPSQLRASHSY
jgi:cytoskeletal protein RodZ